LLLLLTAEFFHTSICESAKPLCDLRKTRTVMAALGSGASSIFRSSSTVLVAVHVGLGRKHLPGGKCGRPAEDSKCLKENPAAADDARISSPAIAGLGAAGGYGWSGELELNQHVPAGDQVLYR
jgi:hypothetical protein